MRLLVALAAAAVLFQVFGAPDKRVDNAECAWIRRNGQNMTDAIKSLCGYKERRAHRHGRHNRRKCTACPPGWGVMYPCNATSDTICEECGSGTYSPHHSAIDGCWVCSQCGWGLFKSHPCTPEADTTCDSCLTARPRPLGEDFDRKCLFGRRPPDLPPPPPPPPRGGGQAVAHRRAINDTSADNEDRGAENKSSLTIAVACIVVFPIAVCVAAAVGVCQYVKRTQSCLVDDVKESAAHEANPLMEVAVPH